MTKPLRPPSLNIWRSSSAVRCTDKVDQSTVGLQLDRGQFQDQTYSSPFSNNAQISFAAFPVANWSWGLSTKLVQSRPHSTPWTSGRRSAELVGDRDQAHAALGEAPDVELKLELVAEEAAEAVDYDRIERRRLRGGRVDHALELGPPVVGGRDAGLHIVGDNLPAVRRAVALRLAELVRDGKIVVGLPAGRDPQVEGSTNRAVMGISQVSGGSKTTRRERSCSRRAMSAWKQKSRAAAGRSRP